ncbi:hypothetical protein V7S43_015426 [Phytophthora oleae]|uniref:Uncharacterized protein n=1 Tax=Phytophthora oleae TaxID=2107226 RepID=A0ABD3EZ75_9STRA
MREDGRPVSDVYQSDSPPNWTAPSPEPEGRAFLVGVPARVEDFRKGYHVANTYGGPCVLVGFESFTDEDIGELSRVISSFTSDQLLLPRSQTPAPGFRCSSEFHRGSQGYGLRSGASPPTTGLLSASSRPLDSWRS